MPGLPASRKIGEIQVPFRARAPIQHHRPLDLVMEDMLDDGLDRREARAAGDEDDRLVGLFAEVERAERSFEAENLASLVLRKQRVGKETARHVADVQLEQLVGMRRRGERKTAALAVLQQQVDVLAGEKLQSLVGGQLE